MQPCLGLVQLDKFLWGSHEAGRCFQRYGETESHEADLSALGIILDEGCENVAVPTRSFCNAGSAGQDDPSVFHEAWQLALLCHTDHQIARNEPVAIEELNTSHSLATAFSAAHLDCKEDLFLGQAEI